MDKEQFSRRVKFILKFGHALHTVGSPAHTIEGLIQELCKVLGIQGHIVSLPTAIFSTFTYHDEEITKVQRVLPMGVNLGKLSQVDQISKKVILGQMSFEEGSHALDEVLETRDPYGKRIKVLCFLFSAAGFMVLFGGHWGDFFASIAIGVFIGILSLFQPDRPIGLIAQMFESLVAIAASFIAYLLAQLVPGLNIGVVIISSLIIFMPGLFITIAIAEIATQNLTSGTSRLMGGVMILLKLTFGVFIGSKLASHFSFNPMSLEFSAIPTWMVLVMLPMTALMATVIFKAQRSDWIWVTLAGVFGYLCSKVGTHYFGAEMGILFGGCCVGAVSNIFARWKDRPSSLFQFPGIILLVPGSMGYRSINFLFEKNILTGLETAFTMLTLALALVVGIFFGNILVKPRLSL
jgi:uncharacterized membrane protein YjjP (DUF1212 family)